MSVLQEPVSSQQDILKKELLSELYNQKFEEKCPNKKYAQITPDIRMAFIKKVLTRQATIREASIEFGIKFSTSKAILQTFRKEGRIGKKKFRQRKSKDGSQIITEFPSQRDLQLFQKLKSELRQEKMANDQNDLNLDFSKEKEFPKDNMRNDISAFTPVSTIPQAQATAVFPFAGQQYISTQPQMFPNQFVLISQHQLQQLQMTINKVQMDLEYQKQLNQQLIDIIKTNQGGQQTSTQLQIKVEAPDNKMLEK